MLALLLVHNISPCTKNGDPPFLDFQLLGQISSLVIKVANHEAGGMGIHPPSDCIAGRPGASEYVWSTRIEPGCFKFPSLVLEDKLRYCSRMEEGLDPNHPNKLS